MDNSFGKLGALLLTIGIFFFSKWLNKKLPNPLTLPILTATVGIIVILLVFNVPYEEYIAGAKWIDLFLGPAVVALAYPLYQQRHVLKRYAAAVAAGVFAGAAAGTASGLLFGMWIGIDRLTIVAMLPKSVTSPVAMDIAREFHASPSLAVTFVMIAGISGAVAGPFLMDKLGISHSLARGLGMGSAAHAIGTAKLMEMDEREGAASSVAMVLSAMIVSVIIPILIGLFLPA